MGTFLLAAALTVAQPPGDRGAGADRDRGTATATGRMEGVWTVVAAERLGRPVAGARTAMLRNNTLVFDAAGNTGTGKSGTGGTGTDAGGTGTGGRGGSVASDFSSLPSLRLDFGTTGTVRVSETGAGTGSTGGTGDRTGGAAGAPAGAATGITRAGVYVLTQEYLAISVMDDLGGTGGRGAGGAGAGGTGGDRGAGAGAGAGGREAGAMDNTATRPYLTLILRRTGGATGVGSDRR